MKIGNRIAQLRKEKSISQTQLAHLIGASREAISKYERGEAVPSVETAKKMADAFGVTLDYLVGEGQNGSFDKKTVQRLIDLEQLPEDDKTHIFYALDGLIKAAKLKTL
jgi:transcriptional regulator with XRE-family HTH domain